jgi:hypothetical protein
MEWSLKKDMLETVKFSTWIARSVLRGPSGGLQIALAILGQLDIGIEGGRKNSSQILNLSHGR